MIQIIMIVIKIKNLSKNFKDKKKQQLIYLKEQNI